MQLAMSLPVADTSPEPLIPMQRKRIELSVAIINDKQIIIVSDSSATSFEGQRSISLDVDALLAQYKRVLALSKALGAKVTYQNRYKHKLSTQKSSIETDLKTHKELYAQLKAGWEKKVAEGIYSGYRDDQDLKRLSKISHAMLALQYRSTPVGMAQEISARLNELEDYLDRAQKAGKDLSQSKFVL